MEIEKLSGALEAILFAAEHPVNVDRLAAAFGESAPSLEEIQKAIEDLKEKYLAPGFGIELRAAQNGFHFVTKIENAEFVRNFLATKPFRLSKSALEVLSIIAYRQPLTRAEIDQVRGIESSHILRVLMERDLVRMAGKAEVPGRPVQYATTPKFLEVMGLPTLSELPPLSELEQLQGHTPPPRDTMEVGLDRFMESTLEAERIDEENQAEYQEINALLEDIAGAEKEVFASPLHAEIAGENKKVQEELKANTKRKPRSTPTEIHYEDLLAVPENATIKPSDVTH